MSKQEVSESLDKLASACSVLLKEDESAALDKESLRTVLAGVRWAQDRVQIVETTAVHPNQWKEIVTTIDGTVRYVHRPSDRYGYVVSELEPHDFVRLIQALPTRSKGSQQHIATDVLDQIRRDADETLAGVEALKAQHEQRLTALLTEFAGIIATSKVSNQAAEQFRKEAVAAEERRGKAFDQQLSRFQQSFGTFETQVRERLDVELERRRESVEQAEAAFSEKHDRITQDTFEASKNILGELQRHLSRAEEIVGVVSKTALAGSYSEVAERERKDANVWRWISVISMIGIIACAIFALAHSLSAGFSTNAFAAKIVTSFAFMILAAYAGRESARHRKSAEHARRMQLELATIDSYLLSLPDEQRHAIKAAVADRIFGQGIEREKSTPEVDAPSPPMLDYLRLALNGGDKT